MANFKPMRGNYTEDGYLIPSTVGTYDPNDYGLYDMAGNVSEWTDDTYDEAAGTFVLDMNPSYKYEAREGDKKIMRRKVIKGGSWKDVGAYPEWLSLYPMCEAHRNICQRQIYHSSKGRISLHQRCLTPCTWPSALRP